MRTYTYASGDIPKVLEGWSKAIEAREKFSPLAACWTSELGGLNKFVHTWVYKDLTERTRVRRPPARPAARGRPRPGAADPAGQQAAGSSGLLPRAVVVGSWGVKEQVWQSFDTCSNPLTPIRWRPSHGGQSNVDRTGSTGISGESWPVGEPVTLVIEEERFFGWVASASPAPSLACVAIEFTGSHRVQERIPVENIQRLRDYLHAHPELRKAQEKGAPLRQG